MVWSFSDHAMPPNPPTPPLVLRRPPRRLTAHATLGLSAYVVATGAQILISGHEVSWLGELLRITVVVALALVLLRHAQRATTREKVARARRARDHDATAQAAEEREALQNELAVRSASSRTKAAFLARLGHHLRTPMHGILGTTELALSGELSPEQRDLLETARESCHALLSTVDQITDSAHIDAGEMRLERDEVDVQTLVAGALRPHASPAAERGIELAARIDSAVPAAVWGDGQRMHQALDLLLGHALLGAAGGAVVLSVDHDANGLAITVADTGEGLAADEAERILKPWEDAGQRRDALLGPSLAAQLVALMGGTITSANARAEGSRFVLTLPLDVARPAPPQPHLDGVTVLIAEGRMTTRAILGGTLRDWGADVVALDDGHEALDALEEARAAKAPHRLVLLDHDLPGREEFERLFARRFGPEDGQLVLLGGGAASGPQLQRPVLPRDLASLFAESPRPEAATAPEPAPQTKAPSDASGNERPLRVLVVEDNPVSRKVAQHLLAASGHTVWLAHHGQAALDMLEQQAVDVVLMDVEMPVLGGLAACRELRAREQARGKERVPVLAMTAHADDDDRRRCSEAGMDGHVAKPVRAGELRTALDEVVGRQRSDAAVAS